ncbi:polyprotein [Tanacetum coccineum]
MKKKYRGSHSYFAEYGNCLFSSSTKWVIDSGALDHMTETFQSYMLQHGILHESSCVYRRAQNGVAERKNRHLLEVAHVIFIRMTVPKPFWADAVSTACFLINRMPSAVLGGNYPYSVLFPTKPLFPIDPKIFGSTCFVQDTQLHCYLVLRDVTFHEDLPYFPDG